MVNGPRAEDWTDSELLEDKEVRLGTNIYLEHFLPQQTSEFLSLPSYLPSASKHAPFPSAAVMPQADFFHELHLIQLAFVVIMAALRIWRTFTLMRLPATLWRGIH